MKNSFWFRKIAGFIVLGSVAVVVIGYVVMTIWNNVLAGVVHVSPITFGQALAIFLLAKILFGNFKSSGGWRGRRHMWNNEMKEKWSHMSPEEKEKFKHEWRDRCKTWNRNQQDVVQTKRDDLL